MAALGSLQGHVSTGVDRRLASVRVPFGEMNDLKRIRVAGRPGSLADQGFARSWAALLTGQAPSRVASREAALALAATRLGGIDAATLHDAGLPQSEIAVVLRRAIDEMCRSVAMDWPTYLESGIDEIVDIPEVARESPPDADFVVRLQAQPRAGATRPGFARLVLEPPENHAEHCYLTAIYAVLLSPIFDADPGVAFLAGLSHHFHNVYLPDSGFTGEELLGDHLVPVMDRFTNRVVNQLPPALGLQVTEARTILPNAETQAGRAFHAGDVFDRVLQMEQYSRVAAFETRQALVDLDLVHPGPTQAFHHEVLTAVGLFP